jgi:hypothetical protein
VRLGKVFNVDFRPGGQRQRRRHRQHQRQRQARATAFRAGMLNVSIAIDWSISNTFLVDL